MNSLRMSAFVAGPLGNNIYLVGSDRGGALYIIDPAADAERIVAEAAKYRFDEAVILLTHAHADHIGAIKEVVRRLGVKRVLLDSGDWEIYHSPYNALVPYLPAQTDLPPVAEPVDCTDFKVLRTPGHTPGGVCYYFPGIPALFSGDTLFYESIGRTDLPGGNTSALLNSIKCAILSITDDDLAVYPGHGESTTIGHERKHNPYL